MGEMVLSRMECVDLFLDLNRVCQEIDKACPFGYDEFLDMLSPKDDSTYGNSLLYEI